MHKGFARFARSLTILGLLIAASGRADAAMLLFTEKFTANGGIGNGTSFGSSAITISLAYNSGSVVTSTTVSTVLATGTINIAGFGTYSLSETLTLSGYSAGYYFGLSTPSTAADTYLTVGYGVPRTIDLTVPLAPATGFVTVSTIVGNSLFTSGGPIIFGSVANNQATAQISSVLEPSSVALGGLAGLTSLIVVRIRRRRSA